MTDPKILAVVGATGAQGGGLVRGVLSDPDSPFRVRALTRDPASGKARALAELGAEVVAADLDDLDSLKRAFHGAHGAYCVTNFWEHFSPTRELTQATNLAEAAQAEGVAHVVWSTLEDTRNWIPLDDDRMPTLMEHYKVPHFDAKGAANAEFTRRGVPTTFLLTSFYWDNFIHFGSGPQRGDDGTLALVFPIGDAKLPGIAAEDIGRCALGIFAAGDEHVGETVGICGGKPTGDEMAAAFTAALGEEVRYQDVPPEVYRSFDFQGADDLGNMFQFKRDFNDYFCAARSVELSRELNPGLMDLEGWLARYKGEVPVG